MSETMSETRIVRENAQGSWVVMAPGSRRAYKCQPTRGDAVAVARRTLRNKGGGVIEVLDTSGDAVQMISVGRVAPTRTADLRVR